MKPMAYILATSSFTAAALNVSAVNV